MNRCPLMAALLLLAGSALTAAREAPGSPAGPALGRAGVAAADFALPTPDGRIIRLSDQRHKVVVLEFLQTTCPSCQKSGETLQKLYDAKAGRGLEVIGISHDRQGMPAIRDYQFQHRLTYPVVLGDLEVAIRYLGITPDRPSFQVPVFIFIGRNGQVVEERSLENPSDREWFEQMPGSLEAAVDRLLGPPARKSPVPRPKSKARRQP